MGHKGIDVRQTGDRIIFRAALIDDGGGLLAGGDALLYLYELQTDGALKSYDWSDNTFKTTALTTETASLTHRKGDNDSTNTGYWTYVLSTLTGFTAGNVCIAVVHHDSAGPQDQHREFQFGSEQGDLVVTAQGDLKATLDGETVELADSEDVYWANVHFTRDETNSKDEYEVIWIKNDQPITSGITNAKIQVIKRADGTDLIAETAMLQIGSTGAQKYDEPANRLTTGEAAVAIVSATIDAATRSWRHVVGRDSS